MKGNVRARGKGRWILTLEMGNDADGRRRRVCVTFHGNKRSADAELARLVAQVAAGEFVEPDRTTLAQYLERWLIDGAGPSVSAKTLERYTEIVQKHLVPSLGHIILGRLQPLQIQTYYREAQESGRRDGKGGLAAQTVVHHHRVLRRALTQAVRWQILSRNPADFADPPRVIRSEVAALDEEGTARLLAAVRGTPLFVPVLLAATTGMRRGEILALRWEDVDLQRATASVRQSLQQIAGGRAGLSTKPPKTASSRRTLELDDWIIAELVRHKSAQAERRLRLGPLWEDHGLVCAADDGQPLVPNQITQRFGKLVAGLGLRVRFHDLRHSHASQMLKQGTGAKVVSERLGHSGVGITLDIYGHLLPGMAKDAARRSGQALQDAIREFDARSEAEGRAAG